MARKQYDDFTVLVQMNEDLYDFVCGLARVMGTSRAGVMRALANAHMQYLESLTRDYLHTRPEFMDKEAAL